MSSDEQPLILLLAGELRMRGGTAYTLRLKRGLTDYGFRVSLIAEDTSQLSREICDKLEVREVTHMTTPLLSRVVLKLFAAEFEDRPPPKLIHIQTRQMLKQGMLLASEWNIPCVVTMHDYLGDREFLRINPHICRRVIAVSDSVRNDLLARTGLSPEVVQVIRSGVDLGEMTAGQEILPDDRPPVIGTAGALEQIKGVHFFLGAAKCVLEKFPEAQFLVSGSGPEEQRLRELVRSLDIEKSVTFVPSLNDFSAAIEAMDIFCLPSLKQGLGSIMLEAMARGRPVIATKTGGVYSVVKDQQNGLIVPPGDVEILAQRIIDLLTRPERARELGEAGRDHVRKEYSVTRMLEQTAKLYWELLETADKPQASSAAG
ncbi:MAG: glycosyltransferase family 4 protein [Planctomycetaceae bacterium]|nr:glycosyltransferase family 4 protein [Planctomycetaceae bacterium]